ncbi:putative enzyme related to lactoylglutathione lyase [Microbacterium resistens]|uniref:Enzyme related to lactoylglutathione lyase n=1 Tax=Microbacterium resistens TaxID=156977 RepID=A0ABU1SBJ7_9MICO|nr:VOC family protein [Microbacterium resistens]MDR6866628.1 putative enzyme related to lactoylglutathione lyase [Microbacterium resistens]
MSIRNEPWPAGTPMWVDLGADDVDAAKAFYTGLFGWEYQSGGQESGGYLLAQLDGKAVAGIGPKQDAQMPTVWTSYIGSDDVDATANAVTEAGGHLIAPPFDVMDSGRMAIATDLTGAAFGIWQAGSHIGAERVNEHGALCWNELHTRDDAAARAFYATVFGYEYEDLSDGGFVYFTFRRAGDAAEVGGIQHDTQIADGVPDYWLTWFAADDVDASTASAAGLGATVLMPVTDSPFGRMSIVQGPQGEVFGLISLPAEQA